MALSTDFKDRCEAIAVQERSLMGLQGYERLSSAQLAEKHNIAIVLPTQIIADEIVRQAFLDQQSVMAAIFHKEGYAPIIILHPHQAPTRRESSLMHEIAHHLLGHRICNLTALLSGKKRNKAQEEEAIYLGSCLQIPRVALKWAHQLGLSHSRVATHFGASSAMVEFRCRMTGVRLSKRERLVPVNK